MEDGDAARLAEVAILEPLPEDHAERIEMLRTIADGGNVPMTECPECGVDLESVDAKAHADTHWPPNTPAALMSREASKRRAAVVRFAAKQRLPAPADPTEEGQ